MTKSVDAKSLPEQTGSGYPEPYRQAVMGRAHRRLGDAFGLKNFGVNLTRLAPGAWSSQRHWHSKEDEFVYVVEGEVVLKTDAGEQVLRPGMCVGFPAGRQDGHHFINRTDRDVLFLAIGDRRDDDECDYPDVDMLVRAIDGEHRFVRKDGTPY
jgi:uncharacterized cupin superfamily protein